MVKAGKKGGGFIDNMFSAGIGAYAAKNSSSMGGLLMTLAKYALVIIGILLAVSVVANLLGTEKFTILPNSPTDPRYPGVAVAPSESQESGYVRTGAGNVYRT